jgi:galactose mutarotase-like enzyme
MIGRRDVDGIEALTLTSDAGGGIEAAFVPSAGMVGCSLRHRGDELLGQRGGLATYIEERSTMGIPLLHPWANRVGRRRFEVAGREVNLDEATPAPSLDPNGLPIHGLLAAASGWRVDRHGATAAGGELAASFAFADHEGLVAAFPFPHRVRFEAALDGAILTIMTAIEACEDAPVPIAFGYHPYLRLPGIDRADWEVEVPVREHLEVDGRTLPTGERQPTSVEAGPLGSRTFDDSYPAPDDGAPFVLAGGGRRIELRVGAGYPFAQVYAPDDDQVIAYEPMTAPTNALVSGGPDLPLLEPGERYEATFSIAVTDLAPIG